MAALLACTAQAQADDAMQQARSKLKDGKITEARQDFESVLNNAKTGPEKFEARTGIGLAYEAEKKNAEARAEFEKALAIEGITPDQAGQALVKIGSAFINEKKIQEGIASIDKARALKGISGQTMIQANLLYGHTYLAYPWVLPQARDAFTNALAMAEITPEQKLSARKGLVKALMGLKKYSEARAVMKEIIASRELPTAEKPATQISIGTTCMLEGKYAEARDEFTKALAIEGASDAEKALIQFQIGLSYYDAGDFEHAKTELQKVLAMPGAGARQAHDSNWDPFFPGREATLRLRKMTPSDDKEKTLTVLFIGSSMTVRAWMPFEVEDLSASAPAGTPRIRSANYVRGGTKIDVFWNDGDGRGTARERIASVPWDGVVLETFYNMKSEDLMKYGRLFSDYAKSKNVKPVFYESPVAKAQPYPEGFRKFHDDNMALKQAVNATLAPVVLAMMIYLGPNATLEQIDAFYADYVHYSVKGKQLVACCIYAALTGCSPVGLVHPKDIAEDDARKLQEAAWKAVREANPDLKPYAE